MDVAAKSEATQGIVLPDSLSRPFKELRITCSILEDRCYTIHGDVVRIYLQLSHTPPLGWSFMFTSLWQMEEPNGARPRAGVEGDAIWIECSPAEMRASYLPELECVVGQANACFRPSLQQKAAALATQQRLDDKARSQLHDLRCSLDPAPPLARKGTRFGTAGRFFSALSVSWSAFKRVLLDH